MKTNRLKILFVMLVVLLVVSTLYGFVPAFAQDITATAEATQTTDTGGGESGETDSIEDSGIPWNVVSVIVLALAGAYSIPRIIDSVRRDPKAIAEIESRANTVPDAAATTLVKAAEVVQSGALLIKEAFDRIPAASKPPGEVDLSLVDYNLLVTELNRRGYVVRRTGGE